LDFNTHYDGQRWGCSKNPHRHSERSEESPVFSFNQKSKEEILRLYSLRM